MYVEEHSGIAFTVRLEGVFDVSAAQRVSDTLARARPGDVYVMDLTRVSEFHELGIAVLAKALSARTAARVALRGLRRHQVRMLRYLGVTPESLASPLQA